MKKYRVAVVGATGLVGQKMIQMLEERNFPVQELIPVASESSAGEKIYFQNKEIEVRELNPEVFRGVDIALFSAGGDVSREMAPVAAQSGAVVIDNSSAWRMEAGVPLVVPEVNAHAIKEHRGIIANPNCSTIQMVVALNPLHRHFKIKRIVVSTYQAVTGTGKKAVEQLEEEIERGTAKNPVYPHPIAYNCLPHIDVFMEENYTKEEWKMVRETRRIMEDETIRVTATTVRVPVLGGHSESINVEFEKSFELSQIYDLLQQAPGVALEDDPRNNRYPMPLYARERDEVFVGRIRRDTTIENGLNLWVVSDNLRKGAATNAIQIAEKMIEMRLL